MALIYAAKNHLRAEWGSDIPFLLHQTDVEGVRRESASAAREEYTDLLPPGTKGFEDQGLGLLLQLSIQIEAYIKRGCDRGWFHAPQASQMMVQLNTLVSSYGSMETIHLTPLPVALLIHMVRPKGRKESFNLTPLVYYSRHLLKFHSSKSRSKSWLSSAVSYRLP